MSVPVPLFSPGHNLAMKVPAAAFEATVWFYEKTLAFTVESRDTDSVRFAFGDKHLWIDRVEGLEKAEVWLDVIAQDVMAAAEHLKAHAVERCDDVETLPDGMTAFWIRNPAGVVHLVAES